MTEREMNDQPQDLDRLGMVTGAPEGARQHSHTGEYEGGVGRPGGAAQNSGGALWSYDELSDGPGRGAD